jgi:predicted amidophosphoribosyltransferase
VGLGREVLFSLERIEAVPKSAFQAWGSRTTALRHYETIRASADLTAAKRITLVDDFLTKGNTLLGAASRLKDVYPQATLAAFAPVRTKGLQPEIDQLVEPGIGRIRERFTGEVGREVF